MKSSTYIASKIAHMKRMGILPHQILRRVAVSQIGPKQKRKNVRSGIPEF